MGRWRTPGNLHSVQITPAQKQWLKEEAEQRGISMSACLTNLIQESLHTPLPVGMNADERWTASVSFRTNDYLDTAIACRADSMAEYVRRLLTRKQKEEHGKGGWENGEPR